MEINVSVTREPVQKYDKQVLEAEVPCAGKDEGLTWKAKFTTKQLDDLTKQAGKKKEDGKEWVHVLYEEVWDKMRAKKPKLEDIHPDMFKSIDEVLIAFTNSVIQLTGLEKVKPKQQKLKKK